MIRAAIRRIWRSAVTGRFVSRLFARKHPRETVRERLHPVRPDHRAPD